MEIRKAIFLSCIIVCAACVPATPSKDDLLENTIAKERELWEKVDITSYQMGVRYTSAWDWYELKITVKDNVVVNVEVNCLIDNDNYCTELSARISPEEYTVQTVFDDLEKSRKNFYKDFSKGWGKRNSSWSESTSITFDAQYHYPKTINFDYPEAWDDEYTKEYMIYEILDK